jgi:hypothetical protein
MAVDLFKNVRLTAREALAQVQALGLSTPSESVAWVRENRDAR